MTFDELYEVSRRGRCYVDKDRLRVLHDATRYAATIDGDAVECGVASGSSAGVIAGALHPSKRLWLYDRWDGVLPEPGPRDVDVPHTQIGGFLADTKARIADVGFPDRQALYRQGSFLDTFRFIPGTVSLLHIDCDLYESVLLTLRTFYDRVSEGGVIVLDDFGGFEGALRAFYAFVRERPGVNPLVTTMAKYQAVWIKGRERHGDGFPFSATLDTRTKTT